MVTRTAAFGFAALIGSVVGLVANRRLGRDDGPGFDRDYREALNALRERVRRGKKAGQDHRRTRP